MPPKMLVAIALVMAGLFVCPTAKAVDLQGRVHLQVPLTLLQLERGRYETAAFEDGPDLEGKISVDQWGISPRFALVLGGVVGPYLEVGASFAVAQSETQVEQDFAEEVETTRVAFEAIPFVHVLPPGGRARVFAGFGMGYGSVREETTVLVTTNTTSQRGLRIAGKVGLHAFVHDRISLDPALEFTGIFDDTRSEREDEFVTGSVHGYRVLLSIGISAWLAGKASP